MKRAVASVFVFVLAMQGGCATNDPKHPDFIVIDGEKLPVVESGEVELTREQYERLVGAKIIELTVDELKLLKSDRDAFEGIVEGADSNGVTLLLSKGSLKESFTAALKSVVPSKVVWLAPHDFHLAEPIAVVAENLELAVSEVLFTFPLSSIITEENGIKVITVEAE